MTPPRQLLVLPSNRRGVRATLTLVIIVVGVVEGILGHFGMAMPESALMALIALVSAAIVGDTVRPSGMGHAPDSRDASGRGES